MEASIANQRADKDSLRNEIITDAIETCATMGLMVKTSGDKDKVEYNHAPVSLFPTPFPNKHYQEAKKNQRELSFMVNDLTRQPHKIHELLQYF